MPPIPPTFDPAIPAANSLIVSQELRDQFNALNDSINDLTNQLADANGRLGLISPALKVVTANYALAPGDQTIVCSAGLNIVITLMPTNADGLQRMVVIKNTTTHPVTVQGDQNIGEPIDGLGFITLATQWETVWLQTDANGGWYRTGKFTP